MHTVEDQWRDAHRRSEMRWMSMEDATIELPARLLALHGREHEKLSRLAYDMATVLDWIINPDPKDHQEWIAMRKHARELVSELRPSSIDL